MDNPFNSYPQAGPFRHTDGTFSLYQTEKNKVTVWDCEGEEIFTVLDGTVAEIAPKYRTSA